MASDAARPAKSHRWNFELKMMLPALIVLAAISIVPFFYLIYMTLNKISLVGGTGISPKWLGLQNWSRMFTDGEVGAGWITMVIFFVATVGLEMLLGIAIALLVHEMIWGRNITLSILLIPMFVAPVIVGLLGRFMVNPTYGMYAWVLRSTHIFTGNILGGQYSAFIAVALMDVWEWTPLIVLITLAGLVSVPDAVIEAARVDGAGYWQRLRHVVGPSISGIVLVALLIRSMDALRYFDVIWQSTSGGPANATKIIPLRLYEVAFQFLNLGYAATIGIVMLALSIAIAMLFTGILRRRGLIG
ncbi:MAG TPA: sugar ABC transporter permease [Mycobacteriales bacterium]|nr:sugar ABC transporter permease [Mycobacteriales bacterium]